MVATSSRNWTPRQTVGSCRDVYRTVPYIFYIYMTIQFTRRIKEATATSKL